MRLFDEIEERSEALGQVGVRALAEARDANVPVYYMQPEFGDDIVREYPDGRRERIPHGGEGVVSLPPRN